MNGFHGAFATGVASQQGTLTLPDTWFRPPFWDLLVLQLLRPNFSNLPCLYSTFHLEYPLVLTRFYFHIMIYVNCYCILLLYYYRCFSHFYYVMGAHRRLSFLLIGSLFFSLGDLFLLIHITPIDSSGLLCVVAGHRLVCFDLTYICTNVFGLKCRLCTSIFFF